ncbi:MAG: ATP-binding protein [Bryobacteraceae bacterium]
MPIIPPAPSGVSECKMFKLLLDKSTPSDGASEKALAFIESANPLVDLIISGPFREYTLHNRDHCKKLIHLAEHFIPEPSLQNLSALEHMVFIYAAYLHDMGMCLTAMERARIVSSDEFQDSLQSWQEISTSLALARKRLVSASPSDSYAIEGEIFELEEAALAAFLRPRHAMPERYRKLIETIKRHANRQDLFEYRGVSFEGILVDICASHNLDAGVLAEVRGTHDERFPRHIAIGGAYLNAQFCAALLRLTDVLDFDRERTPRILFESLGIPLRSLPGAEVSLREWQKHMAVHTIEVNPDEVVVSAETHHPVIEKAIREFCQIIEREVRDTLTVLKQNNPSTANRYLLELPISVRPQIRSVGYVYKDISLSLNQPRVMSLLMGERLYSHPAVSVRELLQNSIDACSVRHQMEGAGYTAEIRLDAEQDDAGRWWLRVLDNGCGMDEYVLSEYFLKVGNSYYTSPEFARLSKRSKEGRHPFTPISRFGIGLVAVFLIGDVLEVSTRSAYSPRQDELGRRLRIERLGALAFVTEYASDDVGTRMRLRLLPEYSNDFPSFVGQIAGYLQQTIIRPKFPISVLFPEYEFTLAGKPGLTLRNNARELLSAKGLEAVVVDIARWSDQFSGMVGIMFAKTEAGKLSHLQDGRYVRLGKSSIEPQDFLEEFGGNRVTVNGFSMTLRKAGRMFGHGKNRLAVFFDLEVRGDTEVEYDISRERIVGMGRIVVLTGLEQAVCEGLRDMGVLDRLTPETRRLIDGTLRREQAAQRAAGFFVPLQGFPPLEDQALLDRIADMVPVGPWPGGLHKSIAKRLSISNSLAIRGIDTLIRAGRVVRLPTRSEGTSGETGAAVPVA